MALRYKVITKENRLSVYAQGRYKRKYTKGRIVKCVPETLGLFVFENEIEAIEFSNVHRGGDDDIEYRHLIVIKVDTKEEKSSIPDLVIASIGRKKYRDTLILNKFYKEEYHPTELTDCIPIRTILCNSLKVLE